MSSWQLVVKDLQGQTINIQVCSPQTATIHQIKCLVAQEDSSMPVFEQRLVFQHTELEDDRLLSSYADIQNGSQLMLIRLIPFQVFVKGMDGSSYTFRIPSKTPQTFLVANFKKLVQERTHLRPEEQRLQYAGKELVDKMTLGDYNVVNNATLHLVSRLRGGSIYKPVISTGTCVVTKHYTTTYKMSCGHSASADGIYSHCLAVIKNGKNRVLCPACSSEWSMKTLKQKTGLSESQFKAIEEGLTRNFCLSMPGVIKCSGCGSVWSSNNSTTSTSLLCSSCAAKQHDGKKATVDLLSKCPIKTIDHATDCPILRACPNCGNVIEHESACRRVQCNRCKTEFCFICLTIRLPSCSNYYPCPERCATAARQCIIPG